LPILTDDKKRFTGECDESILIERLADAPYKFSGKKVNFCGVDELTINPTITNLNSGEGDSIFAIVVADTRTLDQNQHVRVLRNVEKTFSASHNLGGSGTYTVVRKVYLE
jgi:hypothetical protein